MSSADTEATETSEGDEAAAEPVDEVRQGILTRLTEVLGDAVVGSQIKAGDLWVRVRADAWHDAALACRDRLGFDYFSFLSGLDWMPSTAPNPEDAVADVDEEAEGEGTEAVEAQPATEEQAPEEVAEEGWQTGFAGGDTRFQVFARYHSTKAHMGITVKADLDDEAPRVASIADVYRGADWHERETWEMFGFDFVGHPYLTHIYLPGEFEGFPLRKDFPLLAREVKPWPGLVDVEQMTPEQEEAAEAALMASLEKEKEKEKDAEGDADGEGKEAS